MIIPVFTGWLGSLVLEQFLQPRPRLPWRRPATWSLHSGIWLLLFAMLLALLRRPWFAMGLLWAGQGLLLLVHQAKYFSLREAFLFQDFEYFSDTIKHPRLFLPFFGVFRTLAAVIGFLAAFIAGWRLETPGAVRLPGLVLLGSGAVLLIAGAKYCTRPCYQPNDDLQRLGLLSFFWQYARAEQRETIPSTKSPFQETPPAPPKARLPTVIAVQSESFFDPRAMSDCIRPEILARFDDTRNAARYAGRLQVPAWGANTVRTECAFLTGLTPEQLGVHQFNPYRLLAKQGIAGLIKALNSMGYRTIAMHPYPATFYARDRVFPQLGFGEFLDLAAFDSDARDGQFIGDRAVAAKVEQLLRENAGADQPLFIFVITMENHGPLHLEPADPAQNQRHFFTPPPEAWRDLGVYLNHLRHADDMIRQLKDSLQSCPGREGILCWYGDHVPIMPAVYSSLAEPDGRTEYFIWHTDNTTGDTRKPLAADELGALLLQTIRAESAVV